MAYAFKQQSEIEKQVRAIAVEQIDKALKESRNGQTDMDEVVHGLRKRCKKLRGLLRLIKPVFKGYKEENRALREAANGLSGARDAAVMIETFDALVAFDKDRKGDGLIPLALEDAARHLLGERAENAAQGQSQEEMLEQFRSLMEAARERAKGWSLQGKGFDLVGEGLEETYRRFRKKMEIARDEQTPEAFHEWRKDAKYHWYHVTLFQKCAPEVLGDWESELAQLGDCLGDHHDLAVLDDVLANSPGPIVAEEITTLRKVIAERQKVLGARAFELGEQLTVDKPGRLYDRFEDFWRLLDKD